MAPSSYQPPTRGDKSGSATYSQSADSNLSHTQTTVAKLLEGKGDAVFAVRPADTIHSVVELLKENGFGGLAEAVTVLTSAALVAERTEYL